MTVDGAWVSTIGRNVYPYISRVDNATGDPVFGQAYNLYGYRIDPLDWTVTYRLTLGPGTTASSLEYEASEGEVVTVDNPASGWVGHGQFVSGETYSIRVFMSSPTGSVTIRFQGQASDGSSFSGTAYCENPVDVPCQTSGTLQ